ncbi:MAG TPA: toprim domain-containing protein, partial [Candidatus Binatus sp.]|nr:toprim domain-containing protein [Candidatus Binatus sp.]
HFRLLRNFAKRVVLAYDADAAGQAGAGRVYEWERAHDVDVAVAALPPGSDPADLARHDPDTLRAAVAEAQPFLRFRVERVLAGADLTSAEGRAKAAEAALAAVVEHPNELVRDQYLMLVADRCRLDPAHLRSLAERLARRARDRERGPGELDGRRGDGAASAPEDGADAPGRRSLTRERGPSSVEAGRPGLEALRLAVHRPELVAARLEAGLFGDPLQRSAFEALVAAEDPHGAIAEAEQHDPEVAQLLRRLMVEEPATDADDVIVQLVRTATRRALLDIEAQARLEPDALSRLAVVTARVRRDLEDLDEPERATEAADRLLAWLVEDVEENG